jgi:hypothetical protein
LIEITPDLEEEVKVEDSVFEKNEAESYKEPT